MKHAARGTMRIVGAAVGSMLLALGCIFAGATLALLLEAGVPRGAGIAVNVAAFLGMIASYCFALIFALRRLSGADGVPGTVWAGLAACPLLWLLVMASPGSGAQSTPAILTSSGLLVALVAVGPLSYRRTRREPKHPAPE